MILCVAGCKYFEDGIVHHKDCPLSSHAVLADVRAALNSYDEMMRCGVIKQVSGNEFQFSKYEDFKNSMEKLRVQISEHFS